MSMISAMLSDFESLEERIYCIYMDMIKYDCKSFGYKDTECINSLIESLEHLKTLAYGEL